MRDSRKTEKDWKQTMRTGTGSDLRAAERARQPLVNGEDYFSTAPLPSTTLKIRSTPGTLISSCFPLGQ